MCGIAGTVTKKIDHGYPKVVARLGHRGPDAFGEWEGCSRDGRHVYLGHRRLSIIDVENGDQPMTNEDGSVHIVFNGEIYNYRCLREELIRQGHDFKTNSDTEVVIHLFEQHGENSFVLLNGMFAFVIWDSDENSLWLVRDRFGIKPLYYTINEDDGIGFSSELAPLLESGNIPRKINRAALANYLFFDYVPAPYSLIQGVDKLSPGFFLQWRPDEEARCNQFFQNAIGHNVGEEFRLDSAAKRLEQLLQEAVDRQLIADVPIGVFLSGGIDSSLIAAFAKKQGQELKTFSIGFENKAFDESRFAHAVSRHLGTHHFERILSEGDLLEYRIKALALLDEPLADPSIIPTLALSELASRHVKVVLGGDGGDELFGGYPTYFAHILSDFYRMMPGTLKSVFASSLNLLKVSAEYQSHEWKLKRFVQRWEKDLFSRQLHWMSDLTFKDLGKLFPDYELTCAQCLLPMFIPQSSQPLSQVMELDFKTYLPGAVLAKVDRASMMCSLEVRPPFLDNHVVDFAQRLPAEFKVKLNKTKIILKEIAQKYLPHEIAYRKKRGFAIPLTQWMRSADMKEIVSRILRESPVSDSRYLSTDLTRNWWMAFCAGKQDYSRFFWALVVLDSWMRREDIH